MLSKTLTILMADIQGYTSRTSTHTREENQLFIKETHSFIEKHIKDYEGQLVKSMGDGFLATFESPTNAVKCGLSIQKQISRRNTNILDSDNFIRFRIGISTGEVNIDEKGDVYGDAVNIAARIESFAEPNHVFISESTYLSMNQCEVSAMDLGPQQFKNVVREIRVYRVLKDHDEVVGTDTDREKRTFPSKYKYLAVGLSAGILLTVIITAAMIFPRIKDAQKPAPEMSNTVFETIQPISSKTPNTSSDDTESLNLTDPTQVSKVKPEPEAIELLGEKEFTELRTKLKFLEWAIRAEQ